MIPDASSNGTNPLQNYTEIIFVLLLFSMLTFRRVKRGIKGSPYNLTRVIRSPVIMVILFGFFSYDLISNLTYFGFTFIAIIPGLILGDKLGSLDEVYLQSDVIMYKRNAILMGAVSILLVIRLVMEFEINLANLELLTILNCLIGLSLGIYVGEFFHLRKKAANISRTFGEQDTAVS
jgi:hypothetical protein